MNPDATIPGPVKPEPPMRLLQCFTCKILEEIPPYEGPPQYDDLLEVTVQRHQHGPDTTGQLYTIAHKDWNNLQVRAEIVSKITSNSKSTGLGDDFYQTKDTFSDDAMRCFNKHLRPKDSCYDYKAKNKALTPDTKALRKEEGLSKPRPLTYLCQFCPIESNVAQKKRKAYGLYDN